MARNGISLEIFHLALFDKHSWDRVRGALLSYDAALRQQREQVAVILDVVAAECLTNPFQSWKTERLTARFINFFDGLMPDDLDAMVQHGNFEQAFGITRGSRSPRKLRRMMLDSLYGFRSEPVHEGLAMAYEGFTMSGVAAQRRMLASWFAEWAILRYIESPCTTLIGHAITATEAPILHYLESPQTDMTEHFAATRSSNSAAAGTAPAFGSSGTGAVATDMRAARSNRT